MCTHEVATDDVETHVQRMSRAGGSEHPPLQVHVHFIRADAIALARPPTCEPAGVIRCQTRVRVLMNSPVRQVVVFFVSACALTAVCQWPAIAAMRAGEQP